MQKQLEEWRTVQGYEGLYEVSSLGRVRSLKRETTSGKILKQVADKDGYLKVTLSSNNQRANARVHRLVATAFIENTDKRKTVINHKNEIKTDNRADNLEWCTVKYNTRYKDAHIRRMESRKKPILAIRGDEVIRFASITEAGKALGVHHGNISSCLSEKCRKHTAGGYRFEYDKRGTV